MLEKTKKFIGKHKTEIAFIAGAGVVLVGGLVGVYVDKRAFEKAMKNSNLKLIMSVLCDIPKGTLVKTFGAINREGLTTGELGELGKEMVIGGADELTKFTHFIAIGKVEP